MSAPSEHDRFGRVGAVTLKELCAGLIWPNVLRGFGMSLHPTRIVLGVLAVTMLILLSEAGDLLGLVERPELAPRMPAMTFGVFVLGLPDAMLALILNAYDAFLNEPWVWLGIAVVALPAASLFGCGIARSTAVDTAYDLQLSVGESVGFAIRRWLSILPALLIPLVLVALLVGVIQITGLLLLQIELLEWLGALIYGVWLLGALVLAVVWIVFLLGQPMLMGAIGADGADGADAVARTYAYLLNRPGRFLLYLLLGVIVAMLAFILLSSLLEMTISGAEALTGGNEDRGEGFAATAIDFWHLIARLLLWGWVVSYIYTTGTIIYMLMRRVCDEQDIREVWMPGMVGGTTTPERD
jgi:hypothetical protein